MLKAKVISEKENTWGVRVSTSLNSRSLSWLSEVETNGGGIFIPVNHLIVDSVPGKLVPMKKSHWDRPLNQIPDKSNF
jgi:hypothetical protein